MQLLSARGAQKTRDESKKLSMYSKQWLPGDRLRVRYPIYWEDGKPEIAVGAVWGHNVSDIKGLGLKTAFIPSTCTFDENAQPIGTPDVTYQFSRIARIFVNGAKAIEEANIMKKNWPSEAARKEALSDLEKKYDAKNNMNAVKPIIGKVQYYISTEVVSIKMPNGVPDANTITLSSAPLSSKVIMQLYAIMSNDTYAPAPGEEFLEVEWTYPTDADKGKSGQAASVQGLAPDYRLQAQFPDVYKTVASMCTQVSRDAETIKRRATRAVDPAKVLQKLTQYSFLHSDELDAAQEEDVEVLIKNVDLIKELDLTRALENQELIAKIEAAISEAETMVTSVPETIPTPSMADTSMPDLAAEAVAQAETELPDLTVSPEAPKIDDLVQTQTQPLNVGSVSMQALLNNQNNAGVDDEMILDVDFATEV